LVKLPKMFDRPQYCKKHARSYRGYICPECAAEMRKRGDQGEQGYQDRNRVVLETCPICEKRSRWRNPITKEYECLNTTCAKDPLPSTKETGEKEVSNPTSGPGRKISDIPSKGYTENIASVDPEYREALRGSPPKKRGDPKTTSEETPTNPLHTWPHRTPNPKPPKAVEADYPRVSKLSLFLLLAFAFVLLSIGVSLLVGSFMPLWVLLGFSFLVWIWRYARKKRWRRPSIRLIILLLLCVAIVSAFAGVQPLSGYKDTIIVKWDIFYQDTQDTIVTEWDKYQAGRVVDQVEREVEQAERRVLAKEEQSEQEAKDVESARLLALGVEVARQKRLQFEQAEREAEEEAAMIATLRNPSWAQLKDFLLKDDTDKMKYVYPVVVCSDFADKLQRNAREAGWRCAVVLLDMTGYTDPYNYGIANDAGHACNAFETTDRGLVYIDCTRSQTGPLHQDRTASVQVGEQYKLRRIFPCTGWGEVPDGQMGVVRGVSIRW